MVQRVALHLLVLLSFVLHGVLCARKSVNVGAGGEVALTGGSAEASDGLVLVQRELDSLETLIELETKKLDLLRRMRGHVLAGGELPAGMTANGDLEEYLSRGGGGGGGSSSFSSSSDPRRSPRSAGRGDAGRGRDRDRDEADGGSYGSGGRSRASSRGGRGETSADDLLMQRGAMGLNFTVVAAEVMPLRSRSARRAPPTRKSRTGGPAGAGTPQPGSFINVVVVADAMGSLHFFDSDGSSLLSLSCDAWMLDSANAPEACIVSKFSFEVGASISDEPLLAVAGPRGVVSILNLTLWREDQIIAGKKPRIRKDPETGEPLPGQPMPEPPTSRTIAGLGLVVKHEASIDTTLMTPDASDEAGDASASKDAPSDVDVTAMLLFSARTGDSGSRRYLAVAHDNGEVRSFDRNGTMLKSTTLEGSKPALEIKKSGSSLAIAEAGGVSFVSSSRFTFGQVYCKGGMSPVVSMVYDVLSPGMLYVGFQSGDVVLYNTKAKNDKSTTCTKMYKLPTTGGTNGVRLHAARGYVLATTYEGVSIFNTTHLRESGVRLVAKKSLTAAKPSESQGSDTAKKGKDKKGGRGAKVGKTAVPCEKLAIPPASVSWVSGAKLPEVLVVLPTSDRSCTGAGGSGEDYLELFEAMLPYNPVSTDISWMRMPMLFGGLIIVFGWQFFKGKKSGGGFGGRGGRGRGGRGTSGGPDFDEDELASMMGQSGGGIGGGIGGRSGRMGGGGGMGFDLDSARMGGGGGRRGRGY